MTNKEARQRALELAERLRSHEDITPRVRTELILTLKALARSNWRDRIHERTTP